MWCIVTHSDIAQMTSYSTLIETMHLSYRFRDIANYFVKSRQFSHTLPETGLLDVTPFEFYRDRINAKTF